MATDTRMNNQNSSRNQANSNAMTSKFVYKVIASGETLKSGTIISECNIEKKSNKYITGKTHKKKLLVRAEFLERMR